MKEADFIGQMVQETIQTNDNDKSNLLSFSQENSFELCAFYDKKRFCYILHNHKEILEVPKDWGPFKNRISSEFIVSRFDDKDHFLDIISIFYKKDLNSIKIVVENFPNMLSHKSAA